MQDSHGFLGGGRPMYSDRRMRAAAAQHHQQALNCPRCDSLNTKFCYYNNYNLSQPRHFCKNCRRYWTKGGVLRNVPVGGGCRKSKRGSKRKNSVTPPPPRVHNSNSGSTSGESTSAKTTAGAHPSGGTVGCRNAMGAAAIVSKPRPSVTFNGVATSAAVPSDVMNVNFEAMRDQRGFETAESNAGLFTDIGGHLLGNDQNQSLFTVSSGGLSPFRMHQQNQVNHLTSEDDWGQGMLDQAVHVDLAGADWHGNGGTHLGFYGLTSGSNGHWSQSSNQCDVGSDDCHLYPPP